MSDFKQLTAYTNVKCKCVTPTLPPCDLLAKCDWHGDELRVELPQWPEVVTVWVDGKAMAFAPVADEHKRIYDRCINRVGQLEAENEKLRELCATVIDDWMSKVCPTFPFCEYGGEYQDCTDETCGNQIYKQMARELGVKVDA